MNERDREEIHEELTSVTRNHLGVSPFDIGSEMIGYGCVLFGAASGLDSGEVIDKINQIVGEMRAMVRRKLELEN